jgi:hypothetical protein
MVAVMLAPYIRIGLRREETAAFRNANKDEALQSRDREKRGWGRIREA